MRHGLSIGFTRYLSVYIPRMTHICLSRKYRADPHLTVYTSGKPDTYNAPKLTNALPVERFGAISRPAVEQL
jgi:hypothetical protein